MREKGRISPSWREEAINGNSNGDNLRESIGAEYKAAPGTRSSQGKPRKEGKNRPITFFRSAYGSSLFQLQIDELLSKVRPDYERRMVKAESALRKLKEIIERIPNCDAKSVCCFVQVRRSPYLILLQFSDRGS